MLCPGPDTRSAAHIHLVDLALRIQYFAGASGSHATVAERHSYSVAPSFAPGGGGVSAAGEEARLAGRGIGSRVGLGSICMQYERLYSGFNCQEDITCEYAPGIAPYTPGLYAPACCCG